MTADSNKNLGVVFAGQGGQFVGMGKDLAEKYPECGALFERANAVLGYNLADICFNGPEETLVLSNYCQPAIFTVSIVCWTAFRRQMKAADLCGAAGLSLGEWSALHAAGGISFDDTLRVLSARGRFMQEACEERAGSMVSIIGLSPDKLREICAAAGVEISNVNSPEQTALSGEREAIVRAETMAREAGAKRTVILKVAGAYHSRLMESAARRLEQLLPKIPIGNLSVPVVSNVTGQPHGEPADIRRDMVRQVTSPVQWVSCVEWFRARGTSAYVECGPGRVLAGLIKRIDKNSLILSIQDCSSLDQAVSALAT